MTPTITRRQTKMYLQNLRTQLHILKHIDFIHSRAALITFWWPTNSCVSWVYAFFKYIYITIFFFLAMQRDGNVEWCRNRFLASICFVCARIIIIYWRQPKPSRGFSPTVYLDLFVCLHSMLAHVAQLFFDK